MKDFPQLPHSVEMLQKQPHDEYIEWGLYFYDFQVHKKDAFLQMKWTFSSCHKKYQKHHQLWSQLPPIYVKVGYLKCSSTTTRKINEKCQFMNSPQKESWWWRNWCSKNNSLPSKSIVNKQYTTTHLFSHQKYLLHLNLVISIV